MKIKKLYVFPQKKSEKVEVEEFFIFESQGIKGDASFGEEERHVTLMSQDVLDRVEKDKEKGICLKRYKYNVLLDDIDLSKLKVKDKLPLGSGEIELIQRKECKVPDCPLSKERCPIKDLPLFAKVVSSGKVKKNENLEIENR